MPESKLSKRRIEAKERQLEALELRKAGTTYEQIATRLGYSTKGTAHNAIRALMQKQATEAVDELRKMEGDRLDRLQLTIWTQAIGGNLKAIDQVLRIMKRRAALFGLDAPTKVEQTGQDGGAVAYRLVWDDGSGDRWDDGSRVEQPIEQPVE